MIEFCIHVWKKSPWPIVLYNSFKVSEGREEDFYVCDTGFKPRASYMLGKSSTTWSMPPAFLFALWFFCCLLPRLTLNSQSFCLCFLSNWDYRNVPPQPAEKMSLCAFLKKPIPVYLEHSNFHLRVSKPNRYRPEPHAWEHWKESGLSQVHCFVIPCLLPTLTRKSLRTSSWG
jgi:hypothetical protein